MVDKYLLSEDHVFREEFPLFADKISFEGLGHPQKQTNNKKILPL